MAPITTKQKFPKKGKVTRLQTCCQVMVSDNGLNIEKPVGSPWAFSLPPPNKKSPLGEIRQDYDQTGFKLFPTHLSCRCAEELFAFKGTMKKIKKLTKEIKAT